MTTPSKAQLAQELSDNDFLTAKPGDCIYCGKEICNDLGWCNSFKAAPACACGDVERQGWVHRPDYCWPYDEHADGAKDHP